MQQQTTVVVKPDMVLRGEETVAQIRGRYEEEDLLIVQEIRLRFTLETAGKFYAVQGKPWFEGTILAMASGPSVAWKVVGEDAVARVRELNGATDPRQAKPGTIRELFRSAGGPFNSVHGAESPEEAKREWEVVEISSQNQKVKGYDISYRREFCVGRTTGLWIPAGRYEDQGQFYHFYRGNPEEMVGQILKEHVQAIYRMER